MDQPTQIDGRPMITNAMIDYFKFEEDFVEENMRCIPMIVRMKLDRCGIKLKLSEWSKFSEPERVDLANLPCEDPADTSSYRQYISNLVMIRTGQKASPLAVTQPFEWMIVDQVPEMVLTKLKEFRWHISMDQWTLLSELQRFALIKLSRPGHENVNFPLAVKEFGLVS